MVILSAFFFFKQKTAYEMRISDWSSDVCSSDLLVFNNTRVIKARLLGCKESGGRIEVLVERITSPTTALAHIKASKSPKPGSTLILADDAFTATMRGRDRKRTRLNSSH